MVDVGALTVSIPDEDPKNGQYCAFCYRDFIAKTLPKFEDPQAGEPDVEELILKA